MALGCSECLSFCGKRYFCNTNCRLQEVSKQSRYSHRALEVCTWFCHVAQQTGLPQANIPAPPSFTRISFLLFLLRSIILSRFSTKTSSHLNAHLKVWRKLNVFHAVSLPLPGGINSHCHRCRIALREVLRTSARLFNTNGWRRRSKPSSRKPVTFAS